MTSIAISLSVHRRATDGCGKGLLHDLFSRAVGDRRQHRLGKSYTVSSLVQKAMDVLKGAREEPHVFVLDINGEYGKAFPPKAEACERIPDRIYLNGAEFGIPIWFFNAEEICSWLSAAEQTQERFLKTGGQLLRGAPAPRLLRSTVFRTPSALSNNC